MTTPTEYASEYWRRFSATSITTKLIVGAVALVIVYALWSGVSNTIGKASDAVHGWAYGRRDAKDVEQIAKDQAAIDALNTELAAQKKTTDEWRTKYGMALQVADAQHKQGAELDAAITEAYAAREEHADAAPVDISDAELLERLRQHDAKRKR